VAVDIAVDAREPAEVLLPESGLTLDIDALSGAERVKFEELLRGMLARLHDNSTDASGRNQPPPENSGDDTS